MDDSFPIRTCTKCANVLIFTYTCHSESTDLGGMNISLRKGYSWKFVCRACRSTQFLARNEVVCNRETVCRLLNTRDSLLKTILPEYPRPRSFGDAGKITVENMRGIADRPRG